MANIRVFGYQFISSILYLRALLITHNIDHVFTSSGYAEVFIACVLAEKKYTLIDHHPIIMSETKSLRNFVLLSPRIRSIYKDIGEIYHENFNLRKLFGLALYQPKLLLVFLSYYYASCVLVLSDFAMNEKMMILGIKSRVAEPAIDFSFLDKDIPCQPLPQQIRFVSISRLHPNKNIQLAIDAFSEFATETENICTFDIYGVGSLCDDLELRASACINKIGDRNVRLKGFLDESDFGKVMANSEIFISLQYADYNLSVLEALYSGCIVVTTKHTHIPKFVPPELYVKTTSLDLVDIKKAIHRASCLPLPTPSQILDLRQKLKHHYSREIRSSQLLKAASLG